MFLHFRVTLKSQFYSQGMGLIKHMFPLPHTHTSYQHCTPNHFHEQTCSYVYCYLNLISNVRALNTCLYLSRTHAHTHTHYIYFTHTQLMYRSNLSYWYTLFRYSSLFYTYSNFLLSNFIIQYLTRQVYVQCIFVALHYIFRHICSAFVSNKLSIL